ncbi:hypothetical protein H4219_002294 [Mycoemilia scoparia]|uniref:Phosphatidate phosphatase APP1 catalytic domain-containing protein n=1 Tax=Mycoemilia scoparia TaxID=417184 RepID=A0A9W8A1J2_9FUNG|nr:hypothetical protein H4219_002294 [Mycoemilia scoparia]
MTNAVPLTPQQQQQIAEDCLVMFPTIAVPDETEKAWRIQIRGWLFRRDPQGRKVRMANATMRTLIGIKKGTSEESILRYHISYFFAQSLQNQLVHVKIKGFYNNDPETPLFERQGSLTHQYQPHPPRNSSMIPNTTTNNNPPLPPKPAALDAEVKTGLLIDLDDPETPSSLASKEYRPTPPPKPLRDTKPQPCSPGSADVTNSKPPPTPPPKPKRTNDNHNNLHDGIRPTTTTSVKTNMQTEIHSQFTSTTIINTLHVDTVSSSSVSKISRVQPLSTEDEQMMELLDGFQEKTFTALNGEVLGEFMVGFNEMEWLIQKQRESDDKSIPDTLRVQARASASRCHQAFGRVHVLESEGLSVISDIDDTIKTTNITDGKMAVLTATFAKQFLPVNGMAALYRTWQKLGATFHYVSNSPWRLYPMLETFFTKYQFPLGSIHLRQFDLGDFSVENYKGTMDNKRVIIERMLRSFPKRKFVLVGDSGEWDLQLYTMLAKKYPNQIVKILVRDILALTIPPRSQSDLFNQWPTNPTNSPRPPLPQRRSNQNSNGSLPNYAQRPASAYASTIIEPPPNAFNRPIPPSPSTKPNMVHRSSVSRPVSRYVSSTTNSSNSHSRTNSFGSSAGVSSFHTAQTAPPQPGSASNLSHQAADTQANQRDQQFEMVYLLCTSAYSFYASPKESEFLMRLERLCKTMTKYAEARAHYYNSPYNSNPNQFAGNPGGGPPGHQPQGLNHPYQQQQGYNQPNEPRPPLPNAGSYWADIFAHIDQRQFKMWQDYEMFTQGLEPGLCKFFIEADDIVDQLT